MSAWYLDTSAFLKLVGEEPSSDAMHAWVLEREADADRLFSSDILRTEAVRAIRRTGDEDALGRTYATLADVALIRLTAETYDAAALLDPPSLRSLDAIHIAAAQSLGSELGGIVAYDNRLIDAARTVGITSVSPGLDP
ncbi:MAG: type II toxin-antitoxin system VapC family toxin [Acidimicrobiia bacterium]